MKQRRDLKKCHSKEHVAYIGIGSNLGDRLKNCEGAISKLDAHPEIRVTRRSSWTETDPVDYTDQPKFINGAVEIKTSLSPVKLLNVLKGIEKEIGRTPTFRWGPRVIDLDLLLYDSLSMHSKRLTLPHPRMKEREFVKIPLLEINPALKYFFSDTLL